MMRCASLDGALSPYRCPRWCVLLTLDDICGHEHSRGNIEERWTMGKKAFVSLALGFLAIPSSALSAPAYKASDSSDYFAPQKLGRTRRRCIGTEVDCSGNPAAASVAIPTQ